ncbi:LamG domain-containing protein [Lacihabitans sp. LS3-19]|uniref:LamG domain-containing protein n=1 Tax=Lacihabitans sp. LS3-19 TaxID=2487335 RepID=UPI0020CF9713|nr:LamG domain-containing protein [Lacihabitans sp. LS3-19]MCP9770498.1 LamG domain-containing protein [Lacihabitans sp. LS3-19]
MKRIFTFYSFGLLLLSYSGFGQTFSGTTNLSGNLGTNTAADTKGTISITSSLSSVSGGNASFIKYNNFADFYGVNLSFSSVAVANRLRAQAGVPFSITINTSRIKCCNQELGVDETRIRHGIGKNEQGYKYDIEEQQTPYSVFPDPNNKLQTFTINHTFPVGRTEAWIVLQVNETNGSNFLNPYYTTIIIPFMIQGPTLAIVDSLGTTTQPQVPYMVLHKPPGDLSEASILSTQKTCRSFEETYEKDVTNSSRGAVKIGTKGSAGIAVTVDYEIYAQFNGGVTSNDIQIRTNSKETCIEVSNQITTTSLANSNGQATKGDLFIGYGMDMVYGLSRRVDIVGNTIVVDTGLVYAPLTPTIREFVLTEDAILADIALQQTKVNNLGLSNKDRATAQYQIDAWNDVLAANQNNIANASEKLSGTSPIIVSAGAQVNRSYGTNFTQTTSIETKKYLEFTAGFEFKVEIAGSGYTLGHEFTSRNTYGSLSQNSNSGSTIFSYVFNDDDNDSPDGIDIFYVDIFRDPMFGSPLFKLATGTRSSCPFEGGEQRDQPRLEIAGAPAGSHTATINDVSLGETAKFKINLCNNSNDKRTYKLGVGTASSNTSNLMILANGATNITSSPTEKTVSPNTCLNNYDIEIVRQLASDTTAISNLIIEWYAGCESGIKDSIILNASWAIPPPPVLGTLPNANPEKHIKVCGETIQPIPLVATCTGVLETRWYKSPTGGVTLGTNPIVNNIAQPLYDNNAADGDEYYVSCQSPNYISPRSFFGKVAFQTSPVLITESGPLSFCAPGSVTFKSYADNNNKALSLIKTNNQYVEVPHSNSLNLSSSFTFEAWVNYAGENVAIIDKGNYDYLWMLNANGVGNKLGYYERGIGWKYSNGAVPENTWTHVALTLQSGVLRFYINGVESGFVFMGSAFQDNLPMNIGRQQPSSCQCNHFNGSMDELRIWNVAKSQGEIQASMKTGVPLNSAGLVAYYKFNEASGTSVIDATNNNNDGVLVNGASRQAAITVPLNELDVLWTPINTTTSSFTATASNTYTASVSYGIGCNTSVNKTVSVNSNAALVSLSSPNDDIASAIITKTASSLNGKIVATNKITGTARVSYQAKALELNAGFIADAGTVFSAEIGGCQ